MSDLRTILERGVGGATPPPNGFERMLRRRDRKSRNQRIAAGAVGIAVFVAVVWMVTGGPFDRTAGNGHQPAGSATTVPSVAPSPINAPPVEPTPARRAGGSNRTAPWFTPSAIPEVDYVVDLNTGATTPLPDAIIRSSLGKTASHYAISPDGAQLAYVGTGEEGSPQIFIAGIDGSGVRQVTHDPVGADWPAWSPDGTRIAYEGGAEELMQDATDGSRYRDLFVLDVATGESTQIADGVVFPDPDGLQFTPDGSSLVYTGGGFPVEAEMRTVPVAGGQSTILFGGGHRGIGHAGNGSLSPDGSLVTFVGHEVDGPGALRFIVNADGTDLRWRGVSGANPAGMWSPDGSRIVAGRSHGGIIVIDVVTGDALLVAEGSEAIWLDDHTLLVER